MEENTKGDFDGRTDSRTHESKTAGGPPASLNGAGVSTNKALAFVYVGYAFRYLYLLILVPFYGRVLGAGEYGRVLASMSLFQIVWMVTEYGFPSVGLRDIAARQSPEASARVYSQHVSGRLITAIFGLLVGFIGTMTSPLLRERPAFGAFAALAGVTSGFNLGWLFQGTLRFRTSILIEILGFTLNTCTVLLFVRRRDDGWLVLASLFASSLIATIVAHWVAQRRLDRSKLQFAGGIPLIRESTALFAARSIALLTASSSTFILSLFAGAREVGWYGAAERIATAGLSLMLPANQVLIGTVATLVASKETEEAAFALVRRGLALLMALAGLMTVGCLVLATYVIPIALGPDFGPSIGILQIVGLMFPFFAFAQVIEGYVFVPLRYDRVVTAVSFVGGAVTLVLTVVLGRAFFGPGVAWARVLGSLGMCIACVYVLRRERLLARVLGNRMLRTFAVDRSNA